MLWLQTLDNKKYFLWEPSPDIIDPVVLARVLSRLCRFGGHCKDFYSVAQHSLIVEHLIKDAALRLPALLHDAHEAYWGFGDVCRPAKHVTISVYADLRDLATVTDEAIASRFGFDPALFEREEIKHADNVALATEARDLMGPPPVPWEKLPKPIAETLVPMPSERAADLFLWRLEYLSD